jgi:general secretion pathway protein A
MYESHFNLTQPPFSIAPDPAFLYLSSAHREALAHLMYGFTHGGFVLITGEVGTGKTTLLRNLIKQTPPDLDVAFILNPRLTVRELLATLCDELGIPYDADRTTTVKQYLDQITRHLLEAHRHGRSTVMIIDEAQNLSPAVLEQVRLLTNLETDERKLLRIILIGQPELTELLERQELRQLAQRITARYHLGSLNRPDTYAYVMHRLSRAGGNPHLFSQAALRRLFRLSRGTPRLINVIADRALLGAYAAGARQVTARIVSRAAGEVLGKRVTYSRWWLGAAVAVGVAGATWALLGTSGFPELATRTAEPDQTAKAGRSPEPSVPNAVPAAAAPTMSEPPTAPVFREAPSAPGPTPTPMPSGTETQTPTEVADADILATVPANAPTETVPAPATRLPATPSPPDASGDTIITPASYEQMQAERRARTAAQATPRLTPAPATSPPAAAESVEAISRPQGSAFVNRRLAYGAVFERWGVDFGQADPEQIPCDFAPSAGLQCLTERGGWSEIRRLDLPVVLELWDGSASPYYAALTAMADANVTLTVGGRTVQTTQHALRDQWSGAYVVLWQTPPGYYGSIRVGQTHETVGWLRQQLTALVTRPLASPTPNQFDESLAEAVREFQANEGLLTDGIVGPATWIRLADRLNLPQPSLAG